MWRVLFPLPFLSSVWGASSEKYIWPWRAKKDQVRAQMAYGRGLDPQTGYGLERRWRGKRDTSLPLRFLISVHWRRKQNGVWGTKKNMAQGWKYAELEHSLRVLSYLAALRPWVPNGQPHQQKEGPLPPNSPHVHSRNLHPQLYSYGLKSQFINLGSNQDKNQCPGRTVLTYFAVTI